MTESENNENLKATRLSAFRKIDVYPVTCEELSNDRSDSDVLQAVIQGGARILQLRDKKSTKRDLFHKAQYFRSLTTDAGVLLIINDHIDIAMAVNADGVHLGQNDFPVAAARSLIPDKIIGASTHSLENALQAERDGADYVNIGPIFPTATKNGLSQFLGPELIREIAPHISVPFTVMGGINDKNIGEVLDAGARRIAVVTAITMADDIVETVRLFRERIMSATK